LRNKQEIMVNTIPITKARINLGALAKRVHLNKEYLILEKDGIPIVGIMDADELEDYLELQDPKVKRDIAKSTQEFRAGKGRSVHDFLAELQGAKKKATKRRAKV
jgi:PHD/YefM family antitoxin component YafN of YafNO toxin-antitoxin module